MLHKNSFRILAGKKEKRSCLLKILGYYVNSKMDWLNPFTSLQKERYYAKENKKGGRNRLAS